MNHDSLTVDELIELGSTAVPGVFTALSEITAVASAPGVTATVNLEGRLVDLALEPQALAVPPADLASTIFRLTQEASARALNEGIQALTPHVADDVMAELRALVLPAPAPAPREARPEEDLSAVETWAVPR